MAGLSPLQSGSKGSKKDQNGQPKFFFTIWDPFGPISTLLDRFKKELIFCSEAPLPTPTLLTSLPCLALFGPKWTIFRPSPVMNGQPHFKQELIFCSEAPPPIHLGQKKSFMYEMFQNVPYVPKRVPNGQDHLG